MGLEEPERADAFAAALAALASPVRLALLAQLRAPRTMAELRVWGGADDGVQRPLARQTIRTHLDRLIDAGVIVAQPAQRDYGETMEYVLSQQALYALSEEFRDLAALRPEAVPGGGATMARPDEAEGFALRRACLVLVKGVEVGRVFPLPPPDESMRREWLVGRRRGLPVALDFDPFVSSENARIVWESGTYFVQDLEESRNGTALNFALLPKGYRHALRTGDLIGVGRSLLMLRE